MVSVRVLVAGSVMLALACAPSAERSHVSGSQAPAGNHPATVPVEPPASVVASSPPPKSSASAHAPVPDLPPPAESAAPAPSEPLDAVRPADGEWPVKGSAMRCADTDCDLEHSFCCSDHPGACLPRPTAATRLTSDARAFLDACVPNCGYTKYFAALRAMCMDELDRAGQHGSPADVRLCDDSSDCLRGRFCCRDADDFGAWTRNDCRVLRGGSAAPSCGGNEICVAGARCASPGTACIGGKCRKPRRTIACGTTTCSGSDICCVPHDPGGSPSCAPTCPDDSLDFDCASPGDCPAGQLCCLNLSTATSAGQDVGRCKGSCDWGNEAAVCPGKRCASNEDCAACRGK